MKAKKISRRGGQFRSLFGRGNLANPFDRCIIFDASNKIGHEESCGGEGSSEFHAIPSFSAERAFSGISNKKSGQRRQSNE
jgi:hypothetical protein